MKLKYICFTNVTHVTHFKIIHVDKDNTEFINNLSQFWPKKINIDYTLNQKLRNACINAYKKRTK